MKLQRLIGPSLLALALCAQVATAAEPKPKETKEQKPKRSIHWAVSAHVGYRVPMRYYRPALGFSLFNMLGNAVGSMGDAQDREWNSGRFYEQTPDVPVVPYVKQYAEPPSLTELVIESNPPGARVVINGQSMGVTPQNRLEKPGAIYLLIRAEGYEDEVHEFRAGEGPVHIVAELKRHVSQ